MKNTELNPHQVFEHFQGFQDDLLVAELLHVQLEEVVHGEVEQRLPGHVVVDEEVRVRVDDVVQTWNYQEREKS